MGILRAIELAEYHSLAVYMDNCLPLAGDLVPRDALKAGRVCNWLATVSAILRAGRLAQVVPPIIGADRVLVIHLMLRPAAGHVEPSQPVGFVVPTANPDFDIALFGKPTGDRSSTEPSATINYPSENA